MEFTHLLLICYISALTYGQEVEVPKFLHNFCLSSTGYKSIIVIGVYGCARHCGMDSGCKSFTYNTEHNRCLLNEEDSNTASGQFNACPGYIYGERDMVISNVALMGLCSNHSCPAYTTCVPLNSTSSICIVSACGVTPHALLSDNNDDISSTLSAVGETRYLQCNTGYVGHRKYICLANGDWLKQEETCRDCGNPPGKANAVISSGGKTVGSTRAYTCSSTSTASGSNQIRCNENGFWSSCSLYCTPDCVIVSNMQNAGTVATRAPANTTISYTCDVGYTGGPGTRYCDPNGVWESLDIVCGLVNCGDPPMPNGVNGLSYSSFTYQQTVTYTCDVGLVSSHSQMYITCQSNGQWSTVLFQCN